jgi:hypothetical protein
VSRDDGFPRADVDVGYFHDPKMIALARRLRDERATAAHAAVYLAVVLGSWAEGRRATLDDCLPAWWLQASDDVRTNLQEVGLLDDDGRIPERAWSSWFKPAQTRRQHQRDRWNRANARRSSDAVTATSPSGSNGGTAASTAASPRPVPSRPVLDPSSPRAPARQAKGLRAVRKPQTFGEVMKEMGLDPSFRRDDL